MDLEGRALKNGELSMTENGTNNAGEVVIAISSSDNPKTSAEIKLSPSRDPESAASKQRLSDSPVKDSSSRLVKSVPASPETARFVPSANKPPKIGNETLVRRRTLTRSVYSKPKSRFGEQSSNADIDVFDENNLVSQDQISSNSPYRTSLTRGSPNSKASSTRTNSITPKTPLMQSPGGPGDDEDYEEIFKKVELSKEKRKRLLKPKVVVERVAFLCILGCLVAGLTVDHLEKTFIGGLEFWKWCLLVMVIFCGMLVTRWFMRAVVFLIEKNFLLRKKVLYFVHGLKKSVQVFIWLSFILLTWVLLFSQGVDLSKTGQKILHYITWTLVSILIGAFLWMMKTLSLKILASNFHVNRFFDRIQVSVFHHYVLQTLSGRPLIEEGERVGKTPSTGQLSFSATAKGKGSKEKKLIDMGKVHKMKQEKVSAWTMKELVDAVTNSGLSTISSTLEDSANDGEGEQTDKEITNENEAIAAAFKIFRNVAHPGSKYIEEDDLLRFMIKEEVDLFFPLIEGYETGRIYRKALKEWVIKVFNGRKALAHALSDTKTAVKQLNKLVTGILIVVSFVVWLLLMEIATTKVLVLLSSQLVLAAFMFGSTCKAIFEAIIFVFVMHPFDVGDRCVVDGVPMLVEEMNILSTVFMKLDNEKVYYPNSVLATKPISNYFRSPDMGDTVEFSIDFSTPVEKIGLLKEKIKNYLEKNPQHWHPNHNVVVKEIENVNKLKLALYCNHTMNFQEFPEKNRRRSELVLGIKKIFEELNIKYYLLPQQVHLSHIPPQHQQP
ncbi:mechanosensitive ion channel protein 10 [Tripterygium wilfordii]|uniref:Mechanosensitive ion channel protein n=1 Tax=Tripterygium wilfordii TaxID=458696 RepID=A0A7J7DPN3_TRIWF|nr:mechanosensitive ion channel protein 10-like [Tripterygium wilfordii]XP_038699275.1 mechanosensitive ion channel protein 10-like [Tripterygium wilfordii]XP_038699276.1 mechanosensitive ion channel protein 10-like [Tripterygium wilfordii]KAF5748352.1 mechanosensitive ion channel protein 10 [Tripterygium wilfordii]